MLGIDMGLIFKLMIIMFVCQMVWESIKFLFINKFGKVAEQSRDDLDNTAIDLSLAASLYRLSSFKQVLYIIGDKDRNKWVRIGTVKGYIPASNYYIFKIRRRGRSKLFICKRKYLKGDLYGPEITIKGFGIDLYRKTFLFPTPPTLNDIEIDRIDNLAFIEAQVNQRGALFTANIDRWRTVKAASQPVGAAKKSIKDWLTPSYRNVPDNDNQIIEEEEF